MGNELLVSGLYVSADSERDFCVHSDLPHLSTLRRLFGAAVLVANDAPAHVSVIGEQ
jgi:hypothetical protein